jgi:hypothetical protein
VTDPGGGCGRLFVVFHLGFCLHHRLRGLRKDHCSLPWTWILCDEEAREREGNRTGFGESSLDSTSARHSQALIPHPSTESCRRLRGLHGWRPNSKT